MCRRLCADTGWLRAFRHVAHILAGRAEADAVSCICGASVSSRRLVGACAGIAAACVCGERAGTSAVQVPHERWRNKPGG